MAAWRVEDVPKRSPICHTRGARGPERLRFPPVLPPTSRDRRLPEVFPHLRQHLRVHGSEPSRAQYDRQASRGLERFQTMTDLVLTPAPLPVYPAIAARAGYPRGDGGRGQRLRLPARPSGDPARMQMFHQREIVRIGEPEAVASCGSVAPPRGQLWRRSASTRSSTSPPIRSSAAREDARPASRAGAQVRVAVQIADRRPPQSLLQLPPGPLRPHTGSSSATERPTRPCLGLSRADRPGPVSHPWLEVAACRAHAR